VRELIHALSREVDADMVAAVRSDSIDLVPPSVEKVVRPVRHGLRRILEGAKSLAQGDLLHGLDAQIPVRASGPTVVTIHDLAVYDVPWAFSRQWVVGTRATTGHALRKADEVIADSAFTAERIKARCGRTATVVPLAPASDLTPPTMQAMEVVRAGYDLPIAFVLFVGTIEPRKDVGTLAAACRQANLPLILTGRVSASARVPVGARALGYVPVEDLPALYGAATIVAYPSLYEGFGLPPIEAMSCGAPVVAYRIPPLQEVLADAAILTAPHDVDALTAALTGLLADADHRAALTEAGRARARSLTWKETASRTADVYRSLGVPC